MLNFQVIFLYEQIHIGNFQICMSVPLNVKSRISESGHKNFAIFTDKNLCQNLF